MKFRRNGFMLGVSIEPDGARICAVRRQGKGVEASKPFSAPVPAQSFKNDPSSAGMVLRHHLKSASVRPGRCVVCIPMTWAFTSVVDLPELSGADLQGLIELEAERRFPLPASEMQVAVVHPFVEQGARRALLVGVPTQMVSSVEAALKAARLQPVAITLGISALSDDTDAKEGILLQIGNGYVDFAVMSDGGVLALRNLVWSEGDSGAAGSPDAREIARQLRISLAQTASERRGALKSAFLYGADDWTPALPHSLRESLSALGVVTSSGSLSSVSAPVQTAPALHAAAARTLMGLPLSVNVMPKRKSRFHAPARLSSGLVRRAIIGVAAAIFAIIGAFWWQGQHLSKLDAQWTEIAPRVTAVKALQDRVRKYRTWYDSNVPSLSISRCLATAFPEDGTVWVKTLNVKEGVNVTCTGSARSRSEWMQVMDKLGKSGELDDLQVVQTRGDTPFGFTLTFRWKRKE